MKFYPCFGVGNSLLKFYQVFQIHPVYICGAVHMYVYSSYAKLAARLNWYSSKRNFSNESLNTPQILKFMSRNVRLGKIIKSVIKFLTETLRFYVLYGSLLWQNDRIRRVSCVLCDAWADDVYCYRREDCSGDLQTSVKVLIYVRRYSK